MFIRTKKKPERISYSTKEVIFGGYGSHKFSVGSLIQSLINAFQEIPLLGEYVFYVYGEAEKSEKRVYFFDKRTRSQVKQAKNKKMFSGGWRSCVLYL